MSELNSGRGNVDLEACSASLLHAVSALSKRRADLIEERDCQRLIHLGWLEWHGGALRLTEAGAIVCDKALLSYT